MGEPDGAEARAAYEALETLRVQAAHEWGESQRREREHASTWKHGLGKTPLAAARLVVDNEDGRVPRSLTTELNRVDALEQALFFARSSCVEKDFRIRSCEASTLVRDA